MRAPAYSYQADEIFSPEAIEHPQRLYGRMRRESPLARVADTGVHLVASWDLIEEVLARPEDFSANLRRGLMRGDDGQPTVFDLPDTAAARVIATADDPPHAVHRRTVRPSMTAARVSDLEDSIRGWAVSAIEDWAASENPDFVPVAEVIPARVVAKLLGLPDGDVSRFRTWAMMGGDMLAGAIDAERMDRLAVEGLNMAVYLQEHFERARASGPVNDPPTLMQELAVAAASGEISADEGTGISAVMFGAGGESTAALIGSVVLWLASDAGTRATLARDRELIPSFVEEVIRLESPFKFHYRYVVRNADLAGFELSEGDCLMLLWASANRDATRFEDPDELRLDRRYPRDHMSFGRGGHFCVGAGLARLEARIVCEELLARFPGLSTIAEDPRVYAPSIFVRRLERLPLAI